KVSSSGCESDFIPHPHHSTRRPTTTFRLTLPSCAEPVAAINAFGALPRAPPPHSPSPVDRSQFQLQPLAALHSSAPLLPLAHLEPSPAFPIYGRSSTVSKRKPR